MPNFELLMAAGVTSAVVVLAYFVWHFPEHYSLFVISRLMPGSLNRASSGLKQRLQHPQSDHGSGYQQAENKLGA